MKFYTVSTVALEDVNTMVIFSQWGKLSAGPATTSSSEL